MELLFDKTVGTVLKRIRQDNSLTQTQAADLVGIDRPEVVLIESGSRSITAFQMILFCKALKIDISDLLLEIEKSVSAQVAAQEKMSIKKILEPSFH